MWEKLLDLLINFQQLVPQGFNVSSKGKLYFSRVEEQLNVCSWSQDL